MARENGQGRRLLRTTGRQDSRLLRPQRGRMAGVLLACQLGTLSLMHAAFLASAVFLFFWMAGWVHYMRVNYMKVQGFYVGGRLGEA